MVAGADSIEDMALLRHGGMGRVFTAAYAASTLGSFLRSFAFGVRQLDAVASRFLAALAAASPVAAGIEELAIVDADDTVVPVHGYAKQGAGFGYNQVRAVVVVRRIPDDKTHRGHAIIEQVHADLKDSALAHLPSGKFTAPPGWCSR